MIPEIELVLLHYTVQEAVDLGEAGREREGYAALDAGLSWAEGQPIDPDTGLPCEPEPWREELIGKYRSALVRYAGQYRIRFPDPLTQTAQHLRAKAAELRVRSEELRQRSDNLCTRGEALRVRSREAVSPRG